MSMTNEQIALRLKWADALESGRYGQARGHLKVRTNSDTEKVPTYNYCCLGVAKEEFGDNSWDKSGRNLTLSHNACEALALNHADELDHDELSHLNDAEQLTFTEIAAKIRAATPQPTEEKG